MNDLIYENKLLIALIKKIRYSGNNTVYNIIIAKLAYRRYKYFLVTLLNVAVLKIRPHIEPIPVRISGRIYQVPVPISYSRQLKIVFKWLFNAVLVRVEKNIDSRIINELLEICTTTKSYSGKQLKLLQQTAILNRAYTNYRWK